MWKHKHHNEGFIKLWNCGFQNQKIELLQLGFIALYLFQLHIGASSAFLSEMCLFLSNHGVGETGWQKICKIPECLRDTHIRVNDGSRIGELHCQDHVSLLEDISLILRLM
jgi:hypothetical protein